MKNILIVSNSDTCRSRMAQEILNSFGRGMKISTAGVLVGNSVPDVVCQVMEQNGYDFSRRKPCDVATYAQQTWDYVITLCPEAEEVQKEMQGVVRKYVSFNFADPFRGAKEGEECEQLLAIEILQQLQHDSKIHVSICSIVQFGRILQKNKIPSLHTKRGNFYKVIRIKPGRG